METQVVNEVDNNLNSRSRENNTILKKIMVWVVFSVGINFATVLIEFCKNILERGSISIRLREFATLSNGEMLIVSVCIVGSALSDVCMTRITEDNFRIFRGILIGIDVIIAFVSSIIYALHEYAEIGEKSTLFELSYKLFFGSVIISLIILIINSWREE